MPEGFSLLSLKSSVSVPQAVGSPVTPERFPRRGPQNGELVPQMIAMLSIPKSRFHILKIDNLLFCWEKSPCGSAPRSNKLRKSMSVYVEHTKMKILCIKNREPSILLENKPLRERTQEHQA